MKAIETVYNGYRHYVYTLAYPESMGGHVFYVGKGIKNRINHHEQEANLRKPKYGHNFHKINTIRKIRAAGEQVVKAKVALFATHEEAIQYEAALIILMRPYAHLTNLTDGGDGVMGLVATDEQRRRRSEARKGYITPEETRRKISEAHKGVPLSEEHRRRVAESNKKMGEMRRGKPGKPLTEEHRRKISELQRGSIRGPRTEETRQRISASHKTSQRAAEARYRLRESQRGKPARPWSEEQRRKFRATMTGHSVSDATRRKQSEAAKMRLPISDETRRKLSESHRGPRKPCSEETKSKISEVLKNRSLTEKEREARRKSGETRSAQYRERRLQKMTMPIVTHSDETWMNGLMPLSLWEDAQNATE